MRFHGGEETLTRDIEIKNKLTVTRGEVGRDNGGKRFPGTTIKGTWTKPKLGGIRGGRWGWLRWGESGKGKRQTTILEQQ